MGLGREREEGGEGKELFFTDSVKSSANSRHRHEFPTVTNNINQILHQIQGSRDESETSHQTTEMNAKHKNVTWFFALTATNSCAAE